MGSRFLAAAMPRQVHLWFHFVQFMQTKILSNAIRLSLRNEGDGFNLEQRATTQAGLGSGALLEVEAIALVPE